MNKYKPDWPEVRERLSLWWAGKKTDRVVSLVTSPRHGKSAQPLIEKVPDKYTNADVVFRNVDAVLASTFYGGEAIPAHWVYLGPIPLGGYMGCEMHFEPDTVWQSPCRDSWDNLEELSFDPSNRWYRLLHDLTETSLQRAHGNYLVSGQGFGGILDVIASMWGTETTLAAMADHPEAIKTITQALVDIEKNLYDQMDGMTSPHQPGSFDWLCLWAPGRIWTLQSDLCNMISPQMFRDFVLDELRQEARHVDFSLYHLDGPGEIKHLDSLLSIEELDGIQWQPPKNSQDPMNWIDLFRRIQSAGKKILIDCPPERIRPLLDKIPRQNICLKITCPNQTDAEQVLLNLDRIGV